MALCHDVTNDLKAPVPHGPRGRYDNYAEMVEQMDLQVGRLMRFLKSSGLDDNTLILFTADNGTAAKSKLSAKGKRNEFVYEKVVSQFKGQSVPGGKGIPGYRWHYGPGGPGLLCLPQAPAEPWPGHLCPDDQPTV